MFRVLRAFTKFIAIFAAARAASLAVEQHRQPAPAVLKVLGIAPQALRKVHI